MMEEPAVARWWAPLGPDESVEELFVEGSIGYAVEVEGLVIGAILYTEESDPNYRHAAIDITLDTAHHGQGLGSDAIRTLARHLFEERGHHRLIIDPAVTTSAPSEPTGAWVSARLASCEPTNVAATVFGTTGCCWTSW